MRGANFSMFGRPPQRLARVKIELGDYQDRRKEQKQQNDREKWNMINSSFITTLPDTWAISKKFVMLPINRWNDEYERVLLGGLTCDSDDYYNSEQNVNAIFLPKYKKRHHI